MAEASSTSLHGHQPLAHRPLHGNRLLTISNCVTQSSAGTQYLGGKRVLQVADRFSKIRDQVFGEPVAVTKVQKKLTKAEGAGFRHRCHTISPTTPGITFTVADHPGQAVRPLHFDSSSSSKHYLAENVFVEYLNESCGKILRETQWELGDFRPRRNGFVQGVIYAYNMHHNLVIRPDDVWLAIIIQFGRYVNGNADPFMRHMFVQREGKKELTITDELATLETADYDWILAQQTTEELRRNLKDHSIVDWILPNFSTTTQNDSVVGSVAMMATMNEYFSYKILTCVFSGIPQVTLAGTVDDWQEIHERVDKLHNYGESCSKWATMLKKITTQLLQTSQGEIDSQFWSQICQDKGTLGSGSACLSGWLSTFCVFDTQGKWQANKFEVPDGSTLQFPVIDTDDIPAGYLTVDVRVDNGTEFKTLMFAGHMGYHVVDEGKGIAPKVAWAIARKDG